MLMRQNTLPAYNVQTAVDTEHALIVPHTVVLDAADSRCLQPMAEAAKRALGVDCFQIVTASFPPLHPSFWETAKPGHDAGSESRSSSCSFASETAITGRYPLGAALRPRRLGRRFTPDATATATAKAAKELRSPRVQGVSRSLPRCACADLRCACPCVSAFSSANKGG